MKSISRLFVIAFLYYSVVIISSCCDDSKSVLTGMVNTAILSDFDVMAEAINNDVIKTGFVITLFPQTEIASIDFNPINEVYGQDCEHPVTNSLLSSSAGITFSKDIAIGSNNFPAGTNLLDLTQFQSVEITSECTDVSFCEIKIKFPTSLVSSMSVVDGPLTVNFTALTDDNVSFNYDFETNIELL